MFLHLHHQVSGDVRGGQVPYGGQAEADHEHVFAVQIHLQSVEAAVADSLFVAVAMYRVLS